MKMERKFDFVIFGLSINDQFSQNILNYEKCYQGEEFIGTH